MERVFQFYRLSDEGHDVVGLECAEKGCMEFFQEQNIPYTTTDLTECSGKVFKVGEITPKFQLLIVISKL